MKQADYALMREYADDRAARTRAVRDVRKFLSRLIFAEPDAFVNVPQEIRDEARRLWQHYPFPYELHHAAVNTPVIFDAAVVFENADEAKNDVAV